MQNNGFGAAPDTQSILIHSAHKQLNDQQVFFIFILNINLSKDGTHNTDVSPEGACLSLFCYNIISPGLHKQQKPRKENSILFHPSNFLIDAIPEWMGN